MFEFRTKTVYDPAPRFEKLGLVNQLMPSIEYSSGFWPPVAEIVIEPFPLVHEVGWLAFTPVIVGIVGGAIVTTVEVTTHVEPIVRAEII